MNESVTNCNAFNSVPSAPFVFEKRHSCHSSDSCSTKNKFLNSLILDILELFVFFDVEIINN